MSQRPDDAPTATARDRLLVAAADLLDAAGGADVPTRAVCDRAGVQAPTLYHHFGSKQGLLDAVISHGFRQFLTDHPGDNTDADPVAVIRAGWDRHIQFGLENPNFYVRIYGRSVPEQPCGVVSEVEAMILSALEPAAAAGRLRVAPDRAARQILAASTGVVLTLISQPAAERDDDLSAAVRDAIMASVTTRFADDGGERTEPRSLASTAIALNEGLRQAPSSLSPTELALLRDWLGRLAHPENTPAPLNGQPPVR
jgi:AcrR family transcriptional regulator